MRLGVYRDVERRRDSLAEAFGAQSGDPGRGARATVDALLSESPPDRLVIGAEAVDMLRKICHARGREVDRWEVARSVEGFRE